MSVKVVHWNPRRPLLRGRVVHRIRWRRTNNFGDLLGPMIVKLMLQKRFGLDESSGNGRLLTIGSILHLARPGDTVWGSGVNGKVSLSHLPSRLDVRSVRGPETRRILHGLGIECPEVYGDPALLLGQFFSRQELAAKSHASKLLVVPNLHDYQHYRHRPEAVRPDAPVMEVLSRIAAADFVVGSSLHAMVVADALGIPSRSIRSSVEAPLKYEDYYRGTGRSEWTPASTVQEALDIGPVEPLNWDPDPVLKAFPIDLWQVASQGAPFR